MKRGTIEHPKMRALARELGCPELLAVGILEALWHWTARYAPAGDVGKYTNEDISDGIKHVGDAHELVTALLKVGWLDAHESARLVVHDWREHADDAVHVSLARARKLFADGNLPRLTKLSKEERTEAEADYERVRTESARRAHKNRRRAHKNRLPEPSQSLAKPEPIVRGTPRKRGSPPATRSRVRPEAETLTAERIEFALAQGLTEAEAAAEWAAMGDHEYRDPHTDWTRCWRQWVRNAVKFARDGGRGAPRRGGGSTTERTMDYLQREIEKAREGDDEGTGPSRFVGVFGGPVQTPALVAGDERTVRKRDPVG